MKIIFYHIFDYLKQLTQNDIDPLRTYKYLNCTIDTQLGTGTITMFYDRKNIQNPKLNQRSLTIVDYGSDTHLFRIWEKCAAEHYVANAPIRPFPDIRPDDLNDFISQFSQWFDGINPKPDNDLTTHTNTPHYLTPSDVKLFYPQPFHSLLHNTCILLQDAINHGILNDTLKISLDINLVENTQTLSIDHGNFHYQTTLTIKLDQNHNIHITNGRHTFKADYLQSFPDVFYAWIHAMKQKRPFNDDQFWQTMNIQTLKYIYDGQGDFAILPLELRRQVIRSMF